MARLFTAGAEAGSTGVFTGIDGCIVSTTQKRTGAYSFYFNNYKKAWATLPASVTEFYLRLGFYPTAYNESLGGIVFFLDSAGAEQFILAIVNATGLIKLYGGHGASLWATGSHPIVTNAWQCIEVWGKINNDAGTGRVKVLIDGATDIDYTGDTRYTAVEGMQTVYFAKYGDNYGTQCYIDDIAINDTAGSVNNSWIGRGGIYPVVSEAAGTYTDLHASTGNAWDCINEVPPSDADYVSDDTIDQKSTYGMTALVPATGAIACINVIMRALQDAAGTANIARLIRSNGVDSQGSDVGLSTTVKTIQENIETDPGEIAGTAWTIAAVNALEAGAVVR